MPTTWLVGSINHVNCELNYSYISINYKVTGGSYKEAYPKMADFQLPPFSPIRTLTQAIPMPPPISCRTVLDSALKLRRPWTGLDAQPSSPWPPHHRFPIDPDNPDAARGPPLIGLVMVGMDYRGHPHRLGQLAQGPEAVPV